MYSLLIFRHYALSFLLLYIHLFSDYIHHIINLIIIHPFSHHFHLINIILFFLFRLLFRLLFHLFPYDCINMLSSHYALRHISSSYPNLSYSNHHSKYPKIYEQMSSEPPITHLYPISSTSISC